MKRTKLLLHKRILAAVLSGGMLLLPNWGYALPQGGTIVAGNGNISDPSNITGSGNVAIEWNSFNIGKNETVTFSGMQAVLNYVTGNTKSEILGNITGEKVHVFLVNPNGILFGADAKVNVGKLTASTRTIEDRTVFDGSAFSTLSAEAAKKVRGDIINLGELTANKIVLEGDNISLLNAATLKAGSNSDITLRANNKVTVGYEVTAKTTIDVGDGVSGGHEVSDYKNGVGTKGSTVLSGVKLERLNKYDNTEINITDAMLVHNVYELQAIENNTTNITGTDGGTYKYVQGDYMLANDITNIDENGNTIDISKWHNNEGFASIGKLTGDKLNNSVEGGFIGSLDGMEFKISGLNISRTGNGQGNRKYLDYSVGLFTILREDASVKNLQMCDSSITGLSGVGSIAGDNYGTISNVTNEANITAGSLGTAGGIVGNNYGKLDNVINKGTITSTGSDLGGIAGINIGGTISNARNEAAIEAKASNVGGIVGSNSNGGKIINSENNGKITGNNITYVGGICGWNDAASIQNCTNDAVIDITDGSNIGGIVGTNFTHAEILDSHNKQEVKGADYVGGIAGLNQWLIGGENGSSNSGSVTGTGDYVGGIAGASKSNKNTIENCNNSGDVSGTSYVGGIAGTNSNENTTEESRISDSSNSGSVIGKGNFVGGIVGYNNYNGTSEKKAVIENCTNSGAADKKISGAGYVGGIVGYNTGNIYDVTNNINVNSSGNYAGGIVGQNNGVISNSDNNIGAINTGCVTGVYYIGGIAGYSKGTLTDVHNEKDGAIKGVAYVGGIVGYNTGTIGEADKNTSVTNNGVVEATGFTSSGKLYSYSGGIVGYNAKGTIIGSKSGSVMNDGKITGKGYYVGGISGNNTGIINNVYNKGAVNSLNDYVGGIAGVNTGNILKAANKGKVTGSGNYVGGIVANNSKGTISDSYNIGEVKGGNQQVGGISGYNTGTIQNVYNSGKIDGVFYVGGIVGYSSGGTVTNAYNIGEITGRATYTGNIVGGGSGTVTNAYYASFDGDAIAGYLKYQGDDTLLSLEEFGQAFEIGLRDEDKDSWKFYNVYTAPLLKGFLKKIEVNGNDISGVDAVYNGSEQIAGLGGLADGILVGAKKEIGTYTLQDLLYSGQDGYDIMILNDGIKFTIREVPPDEPQQPSQPAVPQEGIYQNALVNIAVTERENRPEQQNIRQRIIDSPIKLGEEQAKVRIEGDGIKFEKEQIRVKVDDDGIKIEEEA
ncbi:GLUG motif-containing protein [uncultured Phascolarctobacterium sp.]|uniref:beta strand repeat-containing protein n=1 Tax=uncultured Phascolarctobacterium sp. TaxID=512296 RepID=UPI0025D45781|nr:GLUG motif-containing protein [uncultured Phascolarctobacterium sp.]